MNQGKAMNQISFAKQEFIGQQVTIVQCTDPTWIHEKGFIIDETKHTFLIQTQKKRKWIAKKTATFAFEQDKKSISLIGSKITFRSEDRIKKAR